MIYYYFISVASIIISSQNRIVFWPALPIIFAACWQTGASPTRIFLFAFLTGLLFDLFTGNTLGQSAIFLLATSCLVFLLKTRFSDNWRIFFAVLLLSQIIFYVSNY